MGDEVSALVLGRHPLDIKHSSVRSTFFLSQGVPIHVCNVNSDPTPEHEVQGWLLILFIVDISSYLEHKAGWKPIWAIGWSFLEPRLTNQERFKSSAFRLKPLFLRINLSRLEAMFLIHAWE